MQTTTNFQLNKYLPLTDEEYFGEKLISSHGLMKCLRSPAHFFASLQERDEQTEAQRLGRICHSNALEPATFSEKYIVAPKFDLRTKEGKELKAKFGYENPGKEYISTEDHAMLMGMKSALLASDTWLSLASRFKHVEQAAFVRPWQDADIVAKFRPDAVGEGFLLEYKTTKDASPEAFANDAARYNYDLQAAFYVQCHELLTGERPRFVFAVQEKEPPFAVAFYEPDEEMLSTGFELVSQAAAKLIDSLGKAEPEAYPDMIENLRLPKWRVNRVFATEWEG